MRIAGNSATRPALWLFVLLISALAAPGSIAQHYEGCFVNGQQVSDAMCNGGGTASSGGSVMSNPMYGNLMSTSRALGGAIVKSLMAPPQGTANPAAPSSASRSTGLNNEGVSLFNQHRTGEAFEKFRQAVAADPANAIAQGNYWHAKAALDHQHGNDDLALSDIRRALGFNPQFPAAQADKSFYEDLLARKKGDADARALADQLSRQAADTDARSLADSLTTQLQKRRAAEAAGIVEPGEVLKDSLNGNQAKKPADDFVPNPVARLDHIDPRSYPMLKSFTAEQTAAHDLNDDGVKAVEIFHDWRRAWGSFAAAYDRDPVGPFSKVIRENMEIAARHLDQGQIQGSAASAPADSSTSSSASFSPHLIAAGSRPPAPPPKAVLPKTYGECNAQFQAQTRACQGADGSWDKAGCFDPAYVRLTECVNGLAAVSVH